MDFTHPQRCRTQRTGREDRRSQFYEISDNLEVAVARGRCVRSRKRATARIRRRRCRRLDRRARPDRRPSRIGWGAERVRRHVGDRRGVPRRSRRRNGGRVVDVPGRRVRVGGEGAGRPDSQRSAGEGSGIVDCVARARDARACASIAQGFVRRRQRPRRPAHAGQRQGTRLALDGLQRSPRRPSRTGLDTLTMSSPSWYCSTGLRRLDREALGERSPFTRSASVTVRTRVCVIEEHIAPE
jgi:hypothetical protein